MTDRISVQGLRVTAVVGVHAWERTAPRDLLVDIEIGLALDAAGRTDDLARTLDYDALARAIRERVAETERRLVEAVAEDVAEVCLRRAGPGRDRDRVGPDVEWVTVRVHKPGAVHDAADVAVTITRGPRASSDGPPPRVV